MTCYSLNYKLGHVDTHLSCRIMSWRKIHQYIMVLEHRTILHVLNENSNSEEKT